MWRTNGTALHDTGPTTGRKAGTTSDTDARLTRSIVANKIRCRWGAPIPEWLWAWAGLIQVGRDGDENNRGT
jgi:hypothetical protein